MAARARAQRDGTGVAGAARRPLRSPRSHAVGGTIDRGRRLAGSHRFRHARPDPRGPGRRSQGAVAQVSLVVVGLNYRTAPIELLERMSVTATQLPKALHGLTADENLAEVVLLSTCNRTEIYAHCGRFHPAVQSANDFLSALSDVGPDEFAGQLYTYYDEAAVSHLFGVTAGIDSMIVGEGEILGQVKEAWRVAQHEGAAGPMLSRVFQHAVEVGKRARTETAIGRHATSVSSAAVALATQRLGSLTSRRVLVLGAGDVGEGMAVALAGAGVGDIKVVNRTP